MRLMAPGTRSCFFAGQRAGAQEERLPPDVRQQEGHEPGAPRTMVGRARIIESLLDGLAAGHPTLLYGPVGAGKSSVLRAIADRFRREARPCGLASRTGSLHDVTAALAGAYPQVDIAGLKQRSVRGALLRAASASPPILLLDGLVGATPPMRSLLHILQGLGAGVLLAAEVDHERDHRRARAMRLAYRELALPRLDGRAIRTVLRPLVRGEALVDELLPLAHGLPGRAQILAARSREPRYWSGGRLLRFVLETDVDAEMTRRAMAAQA
jgi:hypothetical protein